MITLMINGKPRHIDAAPDTPLLWALRDNLELTGTKFGCVAQCGACTAHIDGTATRSCVTRVSAVVGREVITIEAVGASNIGKAVQQAWLQVDVPHAAIASLARS